jgi:hypothetical protein
MAMNGFHFRWVSVVLTMTSVLLAGSATRNSANPARSLGAPPLVGGEKGEPNADQMKMPEGKVETTLKYDTWLWDAEAYFLLSEPNGLNADEETRQAIRSAYRVPCQDRRQCKVGEFG